MLNFDFQYCFSFFHLLFFFFKGWDKIREHSVQNNFLAMTFSICFALTKLKLTFIVGKRIQHWSIDTLIDRLSEWFEFEERVLK